MALERMMAGAEAGAFEAYLRMLRSFERQLEAEARLGCEGDDGEGAAEAARAARARKYRAILHNVGGYYSQFCVPLERAMDSQKCVIDGKLKDYVKLSQARKRARTRARRRVADP